MTFVVCFGCLTEKKPFLNRQYCTCVWDSVVVIFLGHEVVRFVVLQHTSVFCFLATQTATGSLCDVHKHAAVFSVHDVMCVF